MTIIGITGTLAAGKGAMVEYLKEKGFRHFSVRSFLTKELERCGLPVNRDTMVNLANELRTRNSPSYIAEQLYEEAAAAGGNCVIESLRTLGEIDALKKKGNFYLFAVDADSAVRFSRIPRRGSETDRVSYERFLADEQREWTSADPNKQNLSSCIALADYKFINNGTVEELRQAVDVVLKNIASHTAD